MLVGDSRGRLSPTCLGETKSLAPHRFCVIFTTPKVIDGIVSVFLGSSDVAKTRVWRGLCAK